jgi:hypothetical protein
MLLRPAEPDDAIAKSVGLVFAHENGKGKYLFHQFFSSLLEPSKFWIGPSLQ